jgi:hypothetical protein
VSSKKQDKYFFNGTTCKTPFHTPNQLSCPQRDQINISSMVLLAKPSGTICKIPFHTPNQLLCPQRNKINISSMVLLAKHSDTTCKTSFHTQDKLSYLQRGNKYFFNGITCKTFRLLIAETRLVSVFQRDKMECLFEGTIRKTFWYYLQKLDFLRFFKNFS